MCRRKKESVNFKYVPGGLRYQTGQMYVYSQGRRIHSKSRALSASCGLHSCTNVGVQTENIIEYFQIEKLLEDCLLLWGKTEQTLNALCERHGSSEGHHRVSLIDPEPVDSRLSLKSKDGFPFRSKGLQVDGADNLRVLKSQQSSIEKKLLEIERCRSPSKWRTLHAESAHREHGAVPRKTIRRYHFVDVGQSLKSTISTSASPRTPAVRPFFYEIKLVGVDSGRAGREVYTPREHHRFSFTEMLDSKDSVASGSDPCLKDDSFKLQHVEKVLKWLTTVEPRTYLDVEPILTLAKDVLHTVGSECLIRLESDKKKYEKEIRIAREEHKKSIDGMEKELVSLKLESLERYRRLEEDHLRQLEDLRRKSQESTLYQVTFPMTLLRFRNVVLQRRNVVLKQSVSDLQCRSLLEKVFELQNSDKIAILQSLFEKDSLVTDLTADFFLKSSISEVSMISLCQKILGALELRHAGRSTWIHIISQIFMTTPSHLGRRILSWYHHESVLKDGIAVDNSMQTLLQQPFRNDALSELRDDVISARKDVWDVVCTVLEVPKERAFADTVGFHPDDGDVLLALWPDFLIWLEEQNRGMFSISNPTLQSAVDKFKDSALWNGLRLKHTIRRHYGFDLESIPPSTRFSLEETYEIVSAIHCSKETDSISGSLPIPVFVRHFALQRTRLRSSASRFLLRLQTSVKSYYKGNTRIRTFGRVTGMVHPLRYIECNEWLLRTFWMLLMKMEMSQMQVADCRSNSAILSSPTAQDLIAWMAADRAIESQYIVLAASTAFQTVLHELPNARIIPPDPELVSVFLPAAVNVPAGTKLPVKDLEKLGVSTGNGTEQDLQGSMKERPLSLDLASEIVLDMFVKLVQKWEDNFTALWTESQDNWDWGSNENAPDLDSLRLFLAKRCNLTLQDHDLVSLFADLTKYTDDIDHGSAASICFRHLHTWKCVNVSRSPIHNSESALHQHKAGYKLGCSTKNQGLEYMH